MKAECSLPGQLDMISTFPLVQRARKAIAVKNAQLYPKHRVPLSCIITVNSGGDMTDVLGATASYTWVQKDTKQTNASKHLSTVVTLSLVRYLRRFIAGATFWCQFMKWQISRRRLEAHSSRRIGLLDLIRADTVLAYQRISCLLYTSPSPRDA